MRDYLKDAKKRYIKRIRQQKNKKSFRVYKAINYSALMAIIEEKIILLKYLKGTPDRIVNGRLIKGTPGAWQGIWDKSGLKTLKNILRLGDRDIPENLVFGQQDYADYQMNRVADEICRTTGEQIKNRVQKGLLDGKSLDEIATDLQGTDEHNQTFGYGRAMTIARTESTNAISGAQLRAFNQAETDFGLTVKKSWIANRDKRTRVEHLDLETKYGRDDQAIPNGEDFKIAGFAGMGPGQFGVAAMDINCRCTVVPVVG